MRYLQRADYEHNLVEYLISAHSNYHHRTKHHQLTCHYFLLQNPHTHYDTIQLFKDLGLCLQLSQLNKLNRNYVQIRRLLLQCSEQVVCLSELPEWEWLICD